MPGFDWVYSDHGDWIDFAKRHVIVRARYIVWTALPIASANSVVDNSHCSYLLTYIQTSSEVEGLPSGTKRERLEVVVT